MSDSSDDEPLASKKAKLSSRGIARNKLYRDSFLLLKVPYRKVSLWLQVLQNPKVLPPR